MSALDLPSRYRGTPSLDALSDRAKQLMGQNRELKRENRGKVGPIEAVAFTQIGAALCGVGMARGLDHGALGIAGGVLAGVGWATGQTSMIHAANGVLAPLTAGIALKWYAERMNKAKAA